MQLKLKDFFSTDIECELEHWVPDDPEAIYFSMYLSIENTQDDASYEYQVSIATPQGLQQHLSKYAESFREKPLISNRNLIVLAHYSWNILRENIDLILDKCSADTWDESCVKLQRYFLWEYEDFVQDTDHFKLVRS